MKNEIRAPTQIWFPREARGEEEFLRRISPYNCHSIQLYLDEEPHLLLGQPPQIRMRMHAELLEEFLAEKNVPYKKIESIDTRQIYSDLQREPKEIQIPDLRGERYGVVGLHIAEVDFKTRIAKLIRAPLSAVEYGLYPIHEISHDHLDGLRDSLPFCFAILG